MTLFLGALWANNCLIVGAVDMDEESEQNSGSDRKIAKKRRKGAGSDAETLDGSDYSAKLKRKGKVIIEVGELLPRFIVFTALIENTQKRGKKKYKTP